MARFAIVPTARLTATAMPCKRRCPRQQDVGNDAQTPQIALLVIGLAIVSSAQSHISFNFFFFIIIIVKVKTALLVKKCVQNLENRSN